MVVALYLITALVFLAADAVVLPRLVLPVFQQGLGDELADPVRIGPAAVFYAFFVAALIGLVTYPALQEGTSLARAGIEAAVFGAAAYGTYEFTNLATLQRWTWKMVVVDLTWGVALTAGAAVAGLYAVRLIFAM